MTPLQNVLVILYLLAKTQLCQYNYLCDFSTKFTRNTIGTWTAQSGCQVAQTNRFATGTVAWLGGDASTLLWTNYTIESTFNITSTDASPFSGIIFRATSIGDAWDSGNYYDVALQPLEDRIYNTEFNNGYQVLSYTFVVINENVDNILRVEVSGNSWTIYLNGEYIYSHSDNSYSAGSVGLICYHSAVVFKTLYITLPTMAPTNNPSSPPTIAPSTSISPTIDPSISPTTTEPTQAPATSISPTESPTKPSSNPSISPTTREPTQVPIEATADPTISPTTKQPTTQIPTVTPTLNPSRYSTSDPIISTTAIQTGLQLKPTMIACMVNNIIYSIQFGYTMDNNNAQEADIKNILTKTADNLMQNTIECVIANYTKFISINMTRNIANITLYICADCSDEELLEEPLIEEIQREIAKINNTIFTVNASSTIITISTPKTDTNQSQDTTQNSLLWPILGASFGLIFLCVILIAICGVIKRKKKLDIAVETLKQNEIVLNNDKQKDDNIEDEVEQMYITAATPTGDILDEHEESVEKMYDKTPQATDTGTADNPNPQSINSKDTEDILDENEGSVENMYDNFTQQTEGNTTLTQGDV